MTSYVVRTEQLSGDVILRIPREVVAELGLVAGDAALMRGLPDDPPLVIEDEAERERVERMQRILDENPHALVAFCR